MTAGINDIGVSNMYVGASGIQYMKSSDAKASKCHLKFSSRMIIFIKLVYLS